MKRVDSLLVERGLASSRNQAQRWIAEGKVQSDGVLITKPSLKLAEDASFDIQQDETDRYVSRGGLKLAAALEAENIDVSGLAAIDVGASTGGFTDCLLQAGVASVVCVDVGHDQLVEKIKADPRVSNYEGINAKALPKSLLEHSPAGFDLAVMDVSFISQTKVLPSLAGFIASGGYLITLVKPQFEVGKDNIGKGGIVQSKALYPEVMSKIEQCLSDLGFKRLRSLDSPIKGGDGNSEFLMVAKKLG